MKKLSLCISLLFVILMTACAPMVGPAESAPVYSPTLTQHPAATPESAVSKPVPELTNEALLYAEGIIHPKEIATYPAYIKKVGRNQYRIEEFAKMIFGDDVQDQNGVYKNDFFTVRMAVTGDVIQYRNADADFDKPMGLTRMQALEKAKEALRDMSILEPDLYRNYQVAAIPEMDDASKGWLSREEIDGRWKNSQLHTFMIPHLFNDEVEIFDGNDEGIRVVMTHKGITSLTINVSSFETDADLIQPMHYNEAANAIKDQPTHVVQIELVYSNMLSGGDTYQLCWLFRGDPFSYLYDISLNEFMVV